MTTPPIFISPGIIERIENGSFIPTRRSKSGHGQQERRNILSPLAVTKRCIRYEPNVFYHRRALILQLARSLNQPQSKIVLVGGPQGCGKTSLVRGLIELMGSENEQLLWFDVNRHSDFEEIIQFLIHYITYVCDTQRQGLDTSGTNTPANNITEDPLNRLEKLLGQVAEMPLLLVLDNVEYIVDPELRFNSYPFKEMLNFLLTFPNIKMVLIGERLPHADMSPNQEGITDLHLEGLPQAEAVHFLESLNAPRNHNDPRQDTATLEALISPQGQNQNLRHLQQLWQKTEGQPWLLKIAQHLHSQTNLDFNALNRLLENAADPALPDPHGSESTTLSTLISLIYQRLPDQQRRLFQILAFLRHPVEPQALLALCGVCFPVLGPARLEQAALQNILEHSLLRNVLKISYPPQEVLAHIRRRHRTEAATGHNPEPAQKFKPWYELYHKTKQILYHSLPAKERERIHGVLQAFYRQEKSLEPEKRILKLKNRALLSEAKYHSNAGRERKTASPNGLLNLTDEPPLSSKAYLAGARSSHPSHPSSQRPLTLADYQSVTLPDEASQGSDSLENGQASFLHLLKATSELPWQADDLNELGLSEEEKRLLQQQQTLGELLKQEHASSPLPAPPKPQPPSEAANASGPATDILNATVTSHTEDEQEKSIQARLASAVGAQNHSRVAQELIELARYRASRGRYDSAAQCLTKALSLRKHAPKDVLAEAYRLSGSVNKETYHYNAALPSLLKAAEQIRKLIYEDDTVDAIWLGRLGQVHQDLGEIYAYRQQSPQAIEAFSQALRWYQSADNPAKQAEILFLLGACHDDAGDPDAAIEAYQKSLALDETLNNPASAAATLSNLALLYQEKNQWTEAQHCLQQALEYDQSSQNTEGQLHTLDSLSKLHAQQAQWTVALRHSQRGLSLAIQNRSALWQAHFYTQLGKLYESQAQWPQAMQQFQLAQSSGREILADESLRWLSQKIQDLRTRGQ